MEVPEPKRGIVCSTVALFFIEMIIRPRFVGTNTVGPRCSVGGVMNMVDKEPCGCKNCADDEINLAWEVDILSLHIVHRRTCLLCNAS